MILDGSRKLSTKHLVRLNKVFRLSRFQARYLYWLVLYQDAATPGAKSNALAKLQALSREHKVPTLLESQYRYFTSWYLVAVREALAGTWGSKPPVELARALRIHPQQLEDALKNLQDLGLIEWDPKASRWGVREVAVQTPREVRHHLISQYHRQMIHKGLEALDLLPLDKRDMSALTLSIRKQDLPLLKERIAEFREQLNTEFSGAVDSTQVFQINFQAFPLLMEENS
jgi:uncharacterized protein (TIGR02147 family)